MVSENGSCTGQCIINLPGNSLQTSKRNGSTKESRFNQERGVAFNIKLIAAIHI